MSGGKELLDRLLSSEVKGELLSLFHKNPGLIDRMEGIARRIGRTANAIERDVRDFVDLGILKNRKVGASEVIFLNRARRKEIQDIVADYIRSLKTSKGG